MADNPKPPEAAVPRIPASMLNKLYQMSLLKMDTDVDQTQEVVLAPMFIGPVLGQPGPGNVQYGLLAGIKILESSIGGIDQISDPRLFYNVSAPSSTFICGSQGSGKSHTLSCLLEACMIPSMAGSLNKPLSALVFHYDTFNNDGGGSPCELAFMASSDKITVRVLCAPTNFRTMQRTYGKFPNVAVEPLKIDQNNLNTKRMMDLMGVSQESGNAPPLYMSAVQRILREMRHSQQETGVSFDYRVFKDKILCANLLPSQVEPLMQRLDTLESFMPQTQAGVRGLGRGRSPQFPIQPIQMGSSLVPKAAHMTIVDLSCPCVSSDTACALFNVCFGIFMEKDTTVGRIVALDEAHKYMKESVEARGFTQSLISTVRLQRHLGARIMISTQEPTVSHELLSLCSTTIVHRFSSPSWLHALQGNVAAAALDMTVGQTDEDGRQDDYGYIPPKLSLFHRIVHLRVGEALLFSPNTIAAVTSHENGTLRANKLASGYMLIKVRERLTEDGGKSILA